MEIIQIVGYKNSGKTTVSSQIIRYFSSKGQRVASMKHHGHGGIPEGLKNTDSEKHKQAGAFLSGVEGEGLLQISKNNWTLDEIIQIYSMAKIDILVVEGYKNYPFPKVLLVSKEEDLHLLEELKNIKAIITRISLNEDSYSSPIFHSTKISDFCKWLEEEINKGCFLKDCCF